MQLRNILLIFILSVLVIFAAINWSAIVEPTSISLIFTTVQAPLGLILLTITALLAVFFLTFVVYMQSSILMERQRRLWDQQIGTRIELEQRELAYRNSIAAYEAAVSRYRDLQTQINLASEQSRNNLRMSKTVAGDFTIKSNMNGKVYSLFRNEGEMVNTQTPIAVIGGDGEFMLELQVDEYDIGKIVPGQKVLITMDSYKNEVFEAEVARILPLMNERTRSFTVEANFTKRPEALYPNLTTEANIILQTKEKAITIPRDYLINDSLVIMADGEKRKVVTGVMDFQKVEILSGLTTSDEIMKPVE